VDKSLFMQPLAYLLHLQSLFWFGWIVSIVLLLGFVVGLIVVCSLRKKIFSGEVPTAPSYFDSPSAGLSTASLLMVTGLFGAAFISRYWLKGFMFGPWYLMDDGLDSCILPFQLTQRETPWGGHTHYLVWFIYLIAYRLFGFGPEVARVTAISFFAMSVVIFYWALHRPFGKQVAWFVVGMMLFSSPFIIHSIYATAIAFSLLPTAIILWIVTKPLTAVSAGSMGLVLAASLYLYPGAFLTGLCLIFLHALVFHRSWTWKFRAISLFAFVSAAALSYRIRLVVTSNLDWKQWSGGELSFGGIGPRVSTVLKDTFWESLSFNSLNADAPYFDTGMVGLLIIGMGSSLMFFESQPSMRERKWIWISVMSFLGSVVLSGLGGQYPGVRRVLSSFPLLFLIAGLGLKYLWQSKVFRPFLRATIVVGFALVPMRSYAIGQQYWPTLRYFSRQPDFMVAAGQALLQNTDSRKNVVIIYQNPESPWGGQLHRCALGLDERLNGHFHSVTAIPQSGLQQWQEVHGEFVLFSDELFTENQLQNLFGYPPHSSRVVRFSGPHQSAQLLAIYDFRPDSTQQHTP